MKQCGVQTVRTHQCYFVALVFMFCSKDCACLDKSAERHCLNKVCDQVDGTAICLTSFLYIYEKKKRQIAAEFLQRPRNSAGLDTVQCVLNCTTT